MLDAARAARQLLKNDASDRVVLWVHSHGGQAALFAAQLAPVYAPELRALATAVAAPATDPWARLLAANTPGAVRIGSPLFVAQGEADELVRSASTDGFVAHVRADGTAVTYDRVPGATHGTVALRALRSLFDWLSAEGVSATG